MATLAGGWRWHRILRGLGAGHRAVDAYALVAVGYFGNTMLPARGGELLRVVLLSRQRSPAGKVKILGSIVSERTLDAVSLALLFVALTFTGVGGAPLGRLPVLLAPAVIAARSLSLDVSFAGGAFLVVLSSFFALIPAAPGYVGTFDAAVVFGLKALHIGGSPAVTFAILVRCVLFVPVTLAGLALFVARYRGVQLTSRRRPVSTS